MPFVWLESAPRFVVLIEYREPTYHRKRSSEAQPTYRWTYTVAAASAQAAAQRAMRQFRHDEKQSSVGWVREVVGVSVAPEPSGAPGTAS